MCSMSSKPKDESTPKAFFVRKDTKTLNLYNSKTENTVQMSKQDGVFGGKSMAC